MIDIHALRNQTRTTTITLAGQTYTATIPSAALSRAVRRLLPPPQVSTVTDEKGVCRTDSQNPMQQEAGVYHCLECMAAGLLVAAGNFTP